jgi:hypothetical protein
LYRRVIRMPNYANVFPIFGRTVGATKLFHGWDITRRNSPQALVEAETGADVVTRSEELWELRGFYTVNDAVASEITFQKIAGAVRNELLKNVSIRNLINTWDLYVEYASIDSFSLSTLTGDEFVHQAVLSMKFRHEGD